MFNNGQSAAKLLTLDNTKLMCFNSVKEGSTTISQESSYKCSEGVRSVLGENIVSTVWKHTDAFWLAQINDLC